MPASGSKAGMIAVSVGLLVIGLVAGYFIGKSGSSPVAYPTAIPSVASSLTYSNQDYGFEFQYSEKVGNNLAVEIKDGLLNDETLIGFYNPAPAKNLTTRTVAGKKAYYDVSGDAGGVSYQWLVPLDRAHYVQIAIFGEGDGIDTLANQSFPQILSTFKFTN